MKKEKGPAPLPPSLPILPTSKEPVEEKPISETSITEDIDNKLNRQEVIEPPISTTPENSSSQPEVKLLFYSTRKKPQQNTYHLIVQTSLFKECVQLQSK